TKATASHLVARERKSAAPRALITPVGLPPMPSPPPSERCISTTPTSAAATIAWSTKRKMKRDMAFYLDPFARASRRCTRQGQGAWLLFVHLGRRDDDAHEALGGQARPADQCAPDLIGRKQVPGVLRLDRAAV